MAQPPDNRPSTSPLSDEEAALIIDYRRCSPRRQAAVRRFASKLAVMDILPALIDITTNVIEFKRRKDD
jgi:hypothetical protein